MALFVVLMFGGASSARADLLTRWNQIAIQAIKDQGGAIAGPNPATRALAITHIAIYDALANIEQTHAPYLVELDPPRPISKEAAAIGAAHYALSLLLPARRLALNQILNDALAELPDSEAVDNGVDFGAEVADQIVTDRANDGSTATATFPGSTDNGKWRPLGAAASDQALEPGWRYVVPFALESPSAFRPAAPPALDSTAYAAAVEEVRQLGGAADTAVTGVTRTAEQTTVAKFWIQPTHVPFYAIARQVVNARDLTLFESARFFAHLAIALADSRIAVWDAKYEYGSWRPVSAISVADDGNEDTTEDPDWTSLITPVPAHPEYPSGHSATGAAGAAVLAAWFGEDVGFIVASESLANTTRPFASFEQAARENGLSRIYGGIHFSFANAAGQTLGRAVGEYVVDNLLQPLPPPAEPVDAGTDAGPDEPDAAADAGTPDAAQPAPDPSDADAGSADAGNTIADAGDPPGTAEPKPKPEADSGRPYTADAGAGEGSGGSGKDDDGSCAVARAEGSARSFGSLLLIAAALAWVRRRRQA